MIRFIGVIHTIEVKIIAFVGRSLIKAKVLYLKLLTLIGFDYGNKVNLDNIQREALDK